MLVRAAGAHGSPFAVASSRRSGIRAVPGDPSRIAREQKASSRWMCRRSASNAALDGAAPPCHRRASRCRPLFHWLFRVAHAAERPIKAPAGMVCAVSARGGVAPAPDAIASRRRSATSRLCSSISRYLNRSRVAPSGPRRTEPPDEARGVVGEDCPLERGQIGFSCRAAQYDPRSQR